MRQMWSAYCGRFVVFVASVKTFAYPIPQEYRQSNPLQDGRSRIDTTILPHFYRIHLLLQADNDVTCSEIWYSVSLHRKPSHPNTCHTVFVIVPGVHNALATDLHMAPTCHKPPVLDLDATMQSSTPTMIQNHVRRPQNDRGPAPTLSISHRLPVCGHCSPTHWRAHLLGRTPSCRARSIDIPGRQRTTADVASYKRTPATHAET